MGTEPSPGQLRWRTRRGLRELDLVLQRYLNEQYPAATEADRAAFAALLEQSDADIMDWLLGRGEAPTHMKHVITALGSLRRP